MFFYVILMYCDSLSTSTLNISGTKTRRRSLEVGIFQRSLSMATPKWWGHSGSPKPFRHGMAAWQRHERTSAVLGLCKNCEARAGCPIDGSDCKGYFSRGWRMAKGTGSFSLRCKWMNYSWKEWTDEKSTERQTPVLFCHIEFWSSSLSRKPKKGSKLHFLGEDKAPLACHNAHECLGLPTTTGFTKNDGLPGRGEWWEAAKSQNWQKRQHISLMVREVKV